MRQQIFDCGCVCDLTSGQCDVNCCCDAECTQTELERFAELDACVDEGPADEVVTNCYSTGKQSTAHRSPRASVDNFETICNGYIQ